MTDKKAMKLLCDVLDATESCCAWSDIMWDHGDHKRSKAYKEAKIGMQKAMHEQAKAEIAILKALGYKGQLP